MGILQSYLMDGRREIYGRTGGTPNRWFNGINDGLLMLFVAIIVIQDDVGMLPLLFVADWKVNL